MTVQSTQTPRQYTPGTVAQAQDAAVFERSGAGVYLTMEWIATFVQQTLGNGQAISFGSTAPANSVGDQDDVFFNVTTGEVLRKGATTWAVEANFALDADVTAAITAAFNAHNGAADPHPTYLTQAEATALYKPLTTDDSVATGLRFTLKTVTTGTPATGEVQFNNATLSSVTQLLISETGRDGSVIPTLLDMLQATSRIIIQAEQSEGLYAWFNITGVPTDSGAYRTVPVAFVTAPTGVTTVAGLGVAGAELTLDFYGTAGSGSVAASNVNGVELIQTSLQSLTANDATAIIFPMPASNPINIWTNTNPSRVTAPTAGWYVVTGFVVISASSAIANFSVSLRKNNILYSPQARIPNPAGGVDPGRNVSFGGFLQAGDYFELTVYHDFATDLQTSVADGQNATLSMIRLS